MGNEIVNVAGLKREINKIYQKYLMKGIFYDEPLEEVLELIDKLKKTEKKENTLRRMLDNFYEAEVLEI